MGIFCELFEDLLYCTLNPLLVVHWHALGRDNLNPRGEDVG